LRGWSNRDPFDRIIASTAEVMRIPLLTRDPVFSGLSGGQVIW